MELKKNANATPELSPREQENDNSKLFPLVKDCFVLFNGTQLRASDMSQKPEGLSSPIEKTFKQTMFSDSKKSPGVLEHPKFPNLKESSLE